MTEKHTVDKKYKLDSDIEVWIEPDPYCPILILKRPKAFKKSYPVLSQSGIELQTIIENPESVFVEDIIFNYIANDKYSVQQKLQVADHLEKLVNKMRKMVKEIEESQENL